MGGEALRRGHPYEVRTAGGELAGLIVVEKHRRSERPGWRVLVPRQSSKYVQLEHVASGWTVMHCGHPTALRPYAAHRGDGMPFRGTFRHLVELQELVERAWQRFGATAGYEALLEKR